MSTTLAEVEKIMAAPEYANRIAVLVYEDGNDYVTTYEGREFRADNPFGLDSKLTSAGVPEPRNLFLVSREDWQVSRG